MASNPPAACCFEGFLHEGTPTGYYKELYGLNTYIAEPTSNCEDAAKKGKKTIVILTDIYGNTLPNNCLIADDLAKQGYQVLIPDILLGDSISIKERPNIDIAVWRSKHSNEITKPIVNSFFVSLKQDLEPSFLGVIGHCFGAKYAVQQVAKGSGLADCCAIAHPTMVTIDEVEAISKPILIAAAETDGVFPAELRHQTEDKLKQIGSTYQLSLYGGVTHGFAVRGDISNPVVKYAKEKVLLDQIHWFNTFSA